MIKVFLFTFLFVPVLASAQSIKLQVNLPEPAIKNLFQSVLADKIKKLNSEDLKISEGTADWSAGKLTTNNAVSYSANTGFLGMKVSVSGNLAITFSFSYDGNQLTVRREQVSFKNSSSGLSLFDGIIGTLAENKLPETFNLPKSLIEKNLEGLAKSAKLYDLTMNLRSISLTSLSFQESGMKATLDLDAQLVTADLNPAAFPDAGLLLSRNWMALQLSRALQRNEKLKTKSAQVLLSPERWTLQTRAEYNFKWFWLFKDSFERTVIVNTFPELKEGDLRFTKSKVDVFDDYPGEFSFTNWYVRGRVEDEIEKLKGLKSWIPKQTSVSYAGLAGWVTVNNLTFTRAETTADGVNLGFILELGLSFNP